MELESILVSSWMQARLKVCFRVTVSGFLFTFLIHAILI